MYIRYSYTNINTSPTPTHILPDIREEEIWDIHTHETYSPLSGLYQKKDMGISLGFRQFGIGEDDDDAIREPCLLFDPTAYYDINRLKRPPSYVKDQYCIRYNPGRGRFELWLKYSNDGRYTNICLNTIDCRVLDSLIKYDKEAALSILTRQFDDILLQFIMTLNMSMNDYEKIIEDHHILIGSYLGEVNIFAFNCYVADVISVYAYESQADKESADQYTMHLKEIYYDGPNMYGVSTILECGYSHSNIPIVVYLTYDNARLYTLNRDGSKPENPMFVSNYDIPDPFTVDTMKSVLLSHINEFGKFVDEYVQMEYPLDTPEPFSADAVAVQSFIEHICKEIEGRVTKKSESPKTFLLTANILDDNVLQFRFHGNDHMYASYSFKFDEKSLYCSIDDDPTKRAFECEFPKGTTIHGHLDYTAGRFIEDAENYARENISSKYPDIEIVVRCPEEFDNIKDKYRDMICEYLEKKRKMRRRKKDNE